MKVKLSYYRAIFTKQNETRVNPIKVMCHVTKLSTLLYDTKRLSMQNKSLVLSTRSYNILESITPTNILLTKLLKVVSN